MASVLDQIKKLDEQKAALLEGAKNEALAQAQSAIETLNELGFGYRLVEGAEKATRSASAPTSAGTGTGTRRTGIRDQVLQVIKSSDGVARADLIETMGAKGDKSAEQSISNALSALKKAGTIDAANGVYKAV